MPRFYNSEHGQYEAKGEAVLSSICGFGRFPPGNYVVDLVAVTKDGDGYSSIFSCPARGSHIETLSTQLEAGQRYKITVALSNGVYMRRLPNGEMALYDAATEERVSPYTKDIIPYLNKPLAIPCIVEIRSLDNVQVFVLKTGEDAKA